MNREARECFDTAAAMLQNAINRAGAAANGLALPLNPKDPGYCQPSVAQDIVIQIALGTIRWNAEPPVS